MSPAQHFSTYAFLLILSPAIPFCLYPLLSQNPTDQPSSGPGNHSPYLPANTSSKSQDWKLATSSSGGEQKRRSQASMHHFRLRPSSLLIRILSFFLYLPSASNLDPQPLSRSSLVLLNRFNLQLLNLVPTEVVIRLTLHTLKSFVLTVYVFLKKIQDRSLRI